MSRARPSGPSASLRINSAARARPCAAGNARCRMRRPPVRRMGAVRLQSSDGGILTVLAERVLDDGGVVVGVAQTAPTRFRSGKSVSVHHGRSKYMRLFLSRICQNTSCDDCHYRKPPHIADITLGRYTLDQLIKEYCPFPSPLKRAYIRVRGLLGRIKRKVVG